MKRLTARQERFILEYVKDGNASRAARDSGYSRKCSAQVGRQVLRGTQVRRAIEAALTGETRGPELATRVLAELKRLAFCDPRELFDSAGNLRPITLLPADVGCSIALLDVARAREGSDTVVRVRLWDKLRALELLGKHLSLFVGKVEHAGGITVQWLTPDFSEPSSVADVIDVVAPSAERDDRDADTTKDDS